MIPLNYHHLYYFYVIAREGSITRACAVLHLAQPTLSAQLKQFEKSLKRNLFERNKNRLSLTEEGRTVFEYAKEIFGLAQEMQDTIQSGVAKPREAIRIGVVEGIPGVFSKALVHHLYKRHPKAHVQLKEAPFETLLGMLEKLGLDIFLGETAVSPGEGMQCDSKHVGKIPIVFAAHRDLAKKYKRDIEHWQEVPFVLPAAPVQVSSQVRHLLASGKLTPRVVAEVQSVEVARLLALEKMGIAPVDAYSVSVSKPEKTLVAVNWIFPEPIYENLYLVSRQRKYPNPLVTYLLSTFRL